MEELRQRILEQKEIQKSQLVSGFTNIEEVLEKAKKEMIGTITTGKSGKRYKKVAEGKWVEVSEQGMTKKEHEYQSKYAKEESKKPSFHTSKHEDADKWHLNEASKLSDKEHSDEDVMGESKEKKEDKKENESYNAVREWSGDNLKDEYIESIVDSLSDAGISDGDLKIKKTSNWSQELESNAINNKVEQLFSQHRPGLEHGDMSNRDIKDVLWGMVHAAYDGFRFFD